MSNTALDAYRSARDNQLIRNEARHIRSKINDARGSRHDAGVRWPFELLQNALDAGPRPGSEYVDVNLRNVGTKFQFDHDGAYFTLTDLAALLSGGSSKEFESDDTTGRFGTGFLVTHVLAPQTTVAGIFATDDGLERFELTLDRGGDEDSIVANIAACDAAINAATRLPAGNEDPSASFIYETDDIQTLQLGMASFRSAAPYLFATCTKLGRVSITVDQGGVETWNAEPATFRSWESALVQERIITCTQDGQSIKYRAVRVANSFSPTQAAIAVLVHENDRWKFLRPCPDFPRVFCRYPIRSSAFLPINAILDGQFSLDQERRRILLDKVEVKQTFHASMNAVVHLVRFAYEEEWDGRHWLARAAPSPSSFADKDDVDEAAWLTAEMRSLADKLAKLPLVLTRNGLGISVEGTNNEWYADFVDTNFDGASMSRLWPLMDDAENLFPPVVSLTEAWTTITSGWTELGIDTNQIGLARLVDAVKGDVTHVDKLIVRCEKREWIARFLDVMGDLKGGTIDIDVVDRVLPNQRGFFVGRKELKRDGDISEFLKDIANALGCDVRSRLVDLEITAIAHKTSLTHVGDVLQLAVPTVMTEEDVVEECVRQLERRFPKPDRISDSNHSLVIASIALLGYLAQKSITYHSFASRVPLLARDGTFARASSQRKMILPVETWDERAQAFHKAYAPDRLLAVEYVGTNAFDALVGWELALSSPFIKMSPSDPIKDERLRCLAVEGQDTADAHIHGEEFTQIALLHEILPRCQDKEEAAALLGLALCYMAQVDTSWRSTRVVTGRRSGADLPITVQGALWLADLRARAWVPVRSDEGKTSQVVPTPESLGSLLKPDWLSGNAAALELLAHYFEFDALDLQLLAISDEKTRQSLRDCLAHIAELASANAEVLLEVQAGLEARNQRAQDVARCRKLGLDIQAAIELALKERHLTVKIVDIGYDFDVSFSEIDEAASSIEVGSYFVEVKATTKGDAKLTPKQASTASQRSDNYVLCVVDLRNIPAERLDGPWAPDDILSLAYMVSDIGELVQGTWQLVEEAKTSEVALRNESALRYAVRPEVWREGCSIEEWIDEVFRQSTS